MHPEPDLPVPPRPRLITPAFVLITLASLGYFTADGILIPAVPRYVEGPLAGNDVAVGVSVAAFAVTALLLRPWAGRLGDRRGRRLLMLIGGGAVALSVLGYVVATTVPLLIVFRLMTGFGEAFFFTGAASAINDLAPESRRGEAVSFFSLALYVGIGVGPLIGEALLASVGFTATWLVAGAFAAAAAALALGVPETRPEAEAAAEPVGLIHPAALRPGMGLLASVWGMSGFFAFVPLYALDIGLEGSRFVFLLYSAIVVTIRSFGARIPDIIGPVVASRSALAASTVGLAVAALWSSPVGLFVGVSIFAVGSSLAFPGLMMLALRGAPASQRGAVIGTFTAFVDLGFGIGPATLGVVSEAFGYRGLFLAAAAVAAGGLTLLLTRFRAREAVPA
ncbi:MAG TPA: MFS transporter [Actinomycetota bacterium]|nr:MFS transporter [Actinomycetota bacterium]